MKDINQFTIKEFQEYQELINQEGISMFDILNFFGVEDSYDLPLSEFNKLSSAVQSQELRPGKVKRYYLINGKKYFAQLDIRKLSAGQFIDLQLYLKDFKLEQILSVFMLPTYKEGFFNKEKVRKYNDGYDVLEVQEDLKNHFIMSEANSLSAFFLTSSQSLLTIINNSLIRKMAKMLKKKEKREKLEEKKKLI